MIMTCEELAKELMKTPKNEVRVVVNGCTCIHSKFVIDTVAINPEGTANINAVVDGDYLCDF